MDLRKQVWADLRALGLCSVTASTPENIEITSPLATKAKALETLCAMLGIEAEHVLAMGDSDNDLPMLEFAGIGVAMANGEAHIKAAADMNCRGLQSLWRGKNSGTITKGKNIRRTVHEYFKCSKAQPRLW